MTIPIGTPDERFARYMDTSEESAAFILGDDALPMPSLLRLKSIAARTFDRAADTSKAFTDDQVLEQLALLAAIARMIAQRHYMA